MNKLSSATKTVIITVVCVFAIIAAAFISWHLSAFMNRPTEEHKTYSIKEEIVPIAELATYEYNFTQILYYTSVNTDNPFSIEIPFSENKYIASIEGSTSIFVDAEQIEFEPTYNAGGLLTGVSIILPHAKAKEPVALDFSTLDVLENRDGFMNEISDEQKNALLIETSEEQVKKINESGLLAKADERVKELITTQLKNIYGHDLELTFRFIDE